MPVDKLGLSAAPSYHESQRGEQHNRWQKQVEVLRRSWQRATTSPRVFGLINLNVGVLRRRITKIIATSRHEYQHTKHEFHTTNQKSASECRVDVSRIPWQRATAHPRGLINNNNTERSHCGSQITNHRKRQNVMWTYSKNNGNKPLVISMRPGKT